MYMANATMTRITPARANRRLGECERMTRLGPSGLRMNSSASADGRWRGALRVEGRLRRFRPPLRVRGWAIGKCERSQLGQRPHVDRPLEVDDLANGFPVVNPPMLIELRLGRTSKVELCIFAPEPQ